MITENRFNEIIAQFNRIKPIMVVGDVGVDKYTYGEVTRISPEAPVPVLNVQKEWMKLGLAANVSDNLSCLEVESTLCGVIGEDSNGDTLENLLEEINVKTWGIIRDQSRMTTFKERVVTESQQICRVDYESNHTIDEETYKRLEDRFLEFRDKHSAIILEDYGKGFVDERVCDYLTKHCNDLGIHLYVDPSRSTPPLWYKGAHLLKPNRVESQLMLQALGYNEKDTAKVAEILVDKLDLDKIIITLGADGMGMLDTKADGKFHKIPTVANEVFDVSGAGDTAISTIVASIVSGATLEEAAWIGNCASGVVVSKKGTALVNQTELKDFFKKFKANA